MYKYFQKLFTDNNNIAKSVLTSVHTKIQKGEKMKKRKNIIISAITCMMSICLMMFGVYAASNPSVSINGQVSYTARDASVLVQGKADETGAGISASDFSAVPATKDFSSLTKVTSGKSYLDWTKGETSNDNSDNFSTWTDLDLNFVEDSNGVKDITIGFYMTNYSNYPVKATITVQKDITNVTISDKNQVVILDTYKQNPTSKLAKITLSLDNDSVNVNAQELSINVVFEKYDLTPTNSKLDFNYTTGNSATISGGYYTASIKSDAEGEIVYPATYDDGSHGELPVAPNGFNKLASAIQYYYMDYEFDEAAYTQKNEKITSVVVSEGITELQIGAFAVLTKLENVILPSTLKYIGAAALAFCDSLTQISLPDELETIDTYQVDSSNCVGAFMDSYSLSSITIPKNIKSIGENTFSRCTNLKTLTFAEGSQCTKIGENAFLRCAMENVVLPEGMTTLDEWAFQYCHNLVSITIPSTMTNIDSSSLTCYRLSEVINKSSLDRIGVNGGNVVRNATSGESKIEKYGDYRYIVGDDGTTYLIGYFGKDKNISLPTDRTYAIKSHAFYECQLETLTIPNNVTSIGNDVLGNNYVELANKVISLTIPESVTKIEGGFGCKNLFEIINLSQVDLANSDMVGVVRIATSGASQIFEHNDFKFIQGDDSNLYLVGYFGNDTNLTFPTLEQNYKIRPYAFYGCKNLKKVEIPSCVTSIGESAFEYCTKLEEVIIPEGITKIESMVFGWCKSLTSIELPSTIESFGSIPFFVCTKLETIKINALTPPVNGSSGKWLGCDDALSYIYVPAESVDKYKAASGWSDYADKIQAIV